MPRPFRRPVLSAVFILVVHHVRRLSEQHRSAPLYKRRNLHRGLVGAGIFLFGIVAAFGIAPRAGDEKDVTVRHIREALALPDLAAELPAIDGPAQSYVHVERVRRGDTLAILLNRMQVSDPGAEKFLRSDPAARAFYELHPGQRIEARTNAEGALLWLNYRQPQAMSRAEDSGETHGLVLSRDADGFRIREAVLAADRRTELRSGTIQSSLFGATDAAGIPESVATQMIDIFAGDIDFYRDVHRGDRFRVVYEMYDQDGEPARAGRILAVEFMSGTRLHQAVWYQPAGQAGGYYGFGGQSLRRAFLRAPLQFSRISSGFGGRVHPILNIWRWHTGIDYAAPIGTPIRSTGDGVVVSLGVQNGYGNAIVIQHQGVYSTLYGHLSAFAHGLHRGATVSQGQVIGAVGMTGWATGPHLHYEFRINGVAKDPLHVALPDAPPIEHSQWAQFQAKTRDISQEIELLRAVDLARFDSSPDGKGG